MKLRIQNAMIELGGSPLLESINLEITDHNHIALVGKNGCGKTTLLRAIINNEMFTEGTSDEPFLITKIGNIKIGYIEQINIDDNLTLYEEIVSSFQEITTLERKIASLETNLTNDKNILEYTNLLEKYNAMGGYSYQKDIEVMLSKFGFSSQDKEKKIKYFSGGEKMKISFMKLLLSSCDLLLLDEPTNHLDINALKWLENYLQNYPKAFILVSHDRMFLDNTVNIIYDIEDGELVKYVGNYSQYIKLKEERYQKLLKDYEYQQKEIKRLRSIYERFRFKPTKARMALSRLKQIEKMTIIDKPYQDKKKTFKTNFKDMPKPGKVVLTVKDLVFGYDKPLGKISFDLPYGKRIAIMGSNGTGKSTLLKTINNLIPKIKGSISLGYNVKTAYFDQNLSFATDGSILNEVALKFPDYSEEEIRSLLGSFLFTGEDVNKDIKVLSGGEKVRLLLLEVFSTKANLIFLDEPTNHLDIPSKEKIEKSLLEYPGSLLFVSHDRFLINKLADALIVFENDEVKYYDYGYEEYLNKNTFEEKEIKDNKKVVKKKEERKDKQKKLNTLLKEIDLITKEIDDLNKSLYDENIYNDYQKSLEISNKIKTLEITLKEKEKLWEELDSL